MKLLRLHDKDENDVLVNPSAIATVCECDIEPGVPEPVNNTRILLLTGQELYVRESPGDIAFWCEE